VGLSPLGTAATTDGDCGAIGGIKIGRGNWSTRRKPALEPLCPPQIPYDQTQARTRPAAVGSQQLTIWAMVLPSLFPNHMVPFHCRAPHSTFHIPNRTPTAICVRPWFCPTGYHWAQTYILTATVRCIYQAASFCFIHPKCGNCNIFWKHVTTSTHKVTEAQKAKTTHYTQCINICWSIHRLFYITIC
jgi:hypothetical protein